jgi:hypothetical protein
VFCCQVGIEFLNIVTCKRLDTGSGLIIGFIELVTTNNYKSITDLHTLRITTANTKSSESAISSIVAAWRRGRTLQIKTLDC